VKTDQTQANFNANLSANLSARIKSLPFLALALMLADACFGFIWLFISVKKTQA